MIVENVEFHCLRHSHLLLHSDVQYLHFDMKDRMELCELLPAQLVFVV